MNQKEKKIQKKKEKLREMAQVKLSVVDCINLCHRLNKLPPLALSCYCLCCCNTNCMLPFPLQREKNCKKKILKTKQENTGNNNKNNYTQQEIINNNKNKRNGKE